MNRDYALCVGNNYPGTNAALAGCVNDAVDWQDLLERKGYHVNLLLEARLEQVLEGLVDLVGRAGFGDRVVFTFSGHGTWLPDRDGDEADGRDEALVMADFRQGGLLVDDTLQEIFGALRSGAGALVISDSCHSGTVSRFVPQDGPIEGRRFLSPIEFMDDLSIDKALALEEVPASTPRRTASLISGCADSEYSYDAWFKGRANGALTRTALDSYRNGLSLNNWFKAIRSNLPSASYPQTPQLTTASRYRKYLAAF